MALSPAARWPAVYNYNHFYKYIAMDNSSGSDLASQSASHIYVFDRALRRLLRNGAAVTFSGGHVLGVMVCEGADGGGRSRVVSLLIAE